MKYVYGPVLSRRLGLSLGVDPLPRKVCTYDCIYCQLGRTTSKTLKRRQYVPTDAVIEEVKEALGRGGPLDYITISGSGEPTLHSGIGELVRGIKGLGLGPVAVITNGSLLWREEVAEALLEADVVLPSLDAASEAVFETVNRPHPDLELSRVIEGLKDFRRAFRGKMWLEVLLCRGINDDPKEIEALREAIAEIGPDAVHLNTVVRPGAEEYAYPLSEDRLREIASRLGEKVEIVTAPPHRKASHAPPDLKDRIVRTLQTRPLTLEDLCQSLGLKELEVLKLLDELTDEGKVEARIFDHRIYYEAKGPQALTNS